MENNYQVYSPLNVSGEIKKEILLETDSLAEAHRIAASVKLIRLHEGVTPIVTHEPGETNVPKYQVSIMDLSTSEIIKTYKY